ncbi:MAG TPA: PEPxxWA-CTERM sorting domain-containing protein [Phenylobacterium sp.]|jgi:hypothetical protein|uniref:PEPxxWA-CTERM sorting domain-containing protein n=1 Tax=Phenylobacterium sp. TaxID=1871053 RepID=UPI002D614395|nr:PEPxxWA-CTERM sorting domain-containing protein [Phenylobacterium sp.]HZZ68852.1 PEPxxWA-CTERM sorting domain-containing protein [Phenylobacterium sp.]
MNAFKTLLPAAALAVSLAAIAAPSQAAVIAQYQPVTNAFDYDWVKSSGAGTGGHLFSISANNQTSAHGVATTFSFLEPTFASLDDLPAMFTIDATAANGNPASKDAGTGTFTQPGLNGTFSFVYSGADQTIDGFHLTTGEDLLSGAFTNAWIQGAGGSGSTNVTFDNGGSLVLTSSVINLSGVVPGSEEFSLNMLSVSPHFGATTGKALNSFKANGGGNFSALGVPEPATWGLMILGFGSAGVMLRRRRVAMAAA